MIKVCTEKGSMMMSIKGDIADLMADTCIIIRKIYEGIKEQDEEAADFYKCFCEDELMKDVFKSDEELQEETKELKKKREAILDDIASELKDLADIIDKRKKGE